MFRSFGRKWLPAGWFWEPFWTQKVSKIHRTIIELWCQHDPTITKNDPNIDAKSEHFLEQWFCDKYVCSFVLQRFSKVEGRKSRSTTSQKSIKNRCSKNDAKWRQHQETWCQHWPKINQKYIQKSIQKSMRHFWFKNRSKIEPRSAKRSPRWVRVFDGVKFLGWRGPRTVRKKDRFESKTATPEKGSRHASMGQSPFSPFGHRPSYSESEAFVFGSYRATATNHPPNHPPLFRVALRLFVSNFFYCPHYGCL